jgi:hypothetical protein
MNMYLEVSGFHPNDGRVDFVKLVAIKHVI